MAIFAVKEDQISPEHNLRQILFKQEEYGDVWTRTMRQKVNFKEKTTQIYEASILNPNRFYAFLQGEDGPSKVTGRYHV